MVEQKSKAFYQVRIIVDANIVFSGILNSNGKIGDLLINSGSLLEFIAPSFLRVEINRHYPRICEISGLTINEVRVAENRVCSEITFISEEQIRRTSWISAQKLVADIDPNDTLYIAYS